MEKRTRRFRPAQRGFTLAGVMVILTIVAVVVAYTVPEQWSKIMHRERDKQTIFIMKQYARAIKRFKDKNGGALPTSLDQLKQARLPRLIRGSGEYIDPLTGKVDWVPVGPQANTPAVTPGQVQSVWITGAQNQQNRQPAQGQRPGQGGQVIGPIAGVRPAKTGKAFIALNGAENYEEWTYTVIDLENEIKARQEALGKK
jgi:type II secretory pathway pseudopilin PulG